ncbi:MAG: SGNH/GDSL hydrolase family protein [Rhodospirillales bacterium]|nr:SGNH/GDSL hydrolase family protein [Rhodospirillales bacterium]
MAGIKFKLKGAEFRRVVLINFAVMTAGLLLAEMVFGSWFSSAGWGLLSVPRNVILHHDTSTMYEGGREIRYSRDQYGLRGDYDSLGSLGILFLGGSTTNELYIDDKETWTYRLGELFRQTGKNLSVVNAGIDGQTTIGHVQMLRKWFPVLPGGRTRYIAAYIGVNDVILGAGTDFRELDDLTPDTRSGRIIQSIRNNSALFRMTKIINGWLKARGAKIRHGDQRYKNVQWNKSRPHVTFDEKIHISGEEQRRLLERFSGRVELLIDEIRKVGAEPIIVAQGVGGYRIRDGYVYSQENGSTGRFEKLWRYSAVAMTACRRKKAICIDMFNELLFQDGDFYDALHTTPKGSRKVSEYLFRKLNPLLSD